MFYGLQQCFTFGIYFSVLIFFEASSQNKLYTPINSLTYGQIFALKRNESSRLALHQNLSGSRQLINDFLRRWFSEKDSPPKMTLNTFQLKNEVLNMVSDFLITPSQDKTSLIDKYITQIKNRSRDNFARTRLNGQDATHATVIFSQIYNSLLDGTRIGGNKDSTTTKSTTTPRTSTTKDSFSILLETIRRGIQKIQEIQRAQETVLTRIQKYREVNNIKEFKAEPKSSPSVVRSIHVPAQKIPVSSSDLVTLEKIIYPGKETYHNTNKKTLTFNRLSNIGDQTRFQIVKPQSDKSVSIITRRRNPLEQWEFFEHYFPKILNELRSKLNSHQGKIRRKRNDDFVLKNPFQNNPGVIPTQVLQSTEHHQSGDPLPSLILKRPNAIPPLSSTTTTSPSTTPLLIKPIALQHAAVDSSITSFLTTKSSLLFGVKPPSTSITPNTSNGLTSLNKMAIAFWLSLIPTLVILIPFLAPSSSKKRKRRK